MKADVVTKVYKNMGVETKQNINKFVKAVIINFKDERGDIVVRNSNYGTRRKYPDFTEGKKEAGLHPLQIVFCDLEMAQFNKDRYIGSDNKVHVF